MTKVFRLGKAALMQQWDSLSTPNELPGSPVKGKVGYALMPGKASAIGGFAFYINKNSKRKDAAWEFVRWAAGPEIAKTLAKRGGVPGRTSVMTDPELLKDHPYFPAQLENLKIAQARGSACATCPMIVPTNEYEIIVGTEASYLIAGEKTPQEAADSAAKGLASLLKDFGYTK
jgi:multiple sugar transport system substrate-binding protein